MSVKNIGKFIADQRKSKGLTQEKLATILNIDRTLVSKWERNISDPDLTLLQPLSDALGITIEELLDGKLNNNSNDKCKNENIEVNNEVIMKYIKNSVDRVKLKLIKQLTLVIVIFVIVLSTILFVNYYNKYYVKSINTDTEDFNIEANLVENKRRTILWVRKINYIDKYVGTDKEKNFKTIKISLLSDNDIIYNSTIDSYDNESSLDELLDDVFFSVDSDKINMDIKNDKLLMIIEGENENQKEQYMINLIVN